MKFLQALFWEFVQNLPAVVGFVGAVWLWRHRRRREAVVGAFIASLSGALLIRFTEVKINDIIEPVAVTVTNFLVFWFGILLIMIYLGSEGRTKWSSWRTDILLGWAMGVLIAVSQAIAAAEGQVWGIIVHALAMALPIPLVLIIVRRLVRNAETLGAALLRSVMLAVVMTAIIGLVDYAYLLFV